MAEELFHVLNRGVEKRAVVLDDKDRLRFLHDLYAFNDEKLAQNYILPGRHAEKSRERLVSIHAFCLMENHYHLILSERTEHGISRFLQKFNMGYAKYFNEKYDRSGVLWQGPSKKIPLQRDAHFMYIPYYVHLNPLDHKFPAWRSGGVRDPDRALKYLLEYRWSSHLDYCGVRNFPSIIDTALLTDMVGSRRRYENEIRSIISDRAKAERSLDIEN